MSFAHPRTMGLVDPDLPAVSTLLGSPYPPALRAIVDTAGGHLSDIRVAQVSWSPGRTITVRYSVSISGGELEGQHSLVAVSGRIPPGATLVEGEGVKVGAWRVPYDPALPGMPPAVNPERVGELLTRLGSTPGPVTTRLRAYRPRRRAVVEVKGGEHDLFLKVVRPDRVGDLHRIHRALAGTVPIPASLGYDDNKGIVALQAFPGRTLRQTLEDPALKNPPIDHIVGLVDQLPRPESDKVTSSPIERMPSTVSLLSAITPELTQRLATLSERIGVDTETPDHPGHGDYYEGQIMVTEGRIVGLVDVDTYGWTRRGDDIATLLGHLSVWAPMSAQPDRVVGLGRDILAAAETFLDPSDLRHRTAAVVLSLAPGPFRVQSAAWPSEVEARVALAEHWVESVAGEKSLIPVSGSSNSHHRH